MLIFFQRISTDIFIPSPLDKIEVRMEVENIVVHPDYNKLAIHDADIALLNVKQPTSDICVQEKVANSHQDLLLLFDLQIWPACFPSSEEDYVDLEDSFVRILDHFKLNI